MANLGQVDSVLILMPEYGDSAGRGRSQLAWTSAAAITY
jgi:hypothetical protein